MGAPWEKPKQFSLPPPFEMMKRRTHNDWMETIAWFEFVLDRAQGERQTTNRPDWDRFECEAMLSNVNWVRAKMDKDPITMRRLLRSQAMASGHVDYVNKFALYCTELVYDEP